MILKDYIKEALLSVVEGVEEANLKHKRFRIIGFKRDATGVDGNYVDFDVSVAVEEKSGNKAGGKVGANLLKVVSAHLDAGLEQSSSLHDVHRLKFRVWVSENKL